MKIITEFIARCYLWLIVPLSLIALVQGTYVVEGLLQGSGLHGYFLDRGGNGAGGDGSQAVLISVWKAFVQTVVSIVLAGTLLVIILLLRHRKIDKPER